ncbi:hypothetical protein N7451_006471 [Penicillium sp. IBT 35674x]|nr:hypothetical protein N7451_006471 [Penicillium sp. IBT 35674x]
MATGKPTILLIPGSCNQGIIYDHVAAILRSQGYPVEPITLPSQGGPSSSTMYDDSEYIRQNYLKGLVAQGREIIIVMHSYSGLPGTECIKGFARKDRLAQDLNGGIVGLLYISSLVVLAGNSIVDLNPMLESQATIDGNELWPKNARDMFFNDLDDDVAEKYLAKIVYQAVPSFHTPLTYEGYRSVPTSYLVCTKDATILPVHQLAQTAMLGEGGIRTYSVDAGHFPMLGKPQAVADVIHDVASREGTA